MSKRFAKVGAIPAFLAVSALAFAAMPANAATDPVPAPAATVESPAQPAVSKGEGASEQPAPAPATGAASSDPKPATESASGIETIDLYNLTDIHGHIEQIKDKKTTQVKEAGLASMACYVDGARAQNPSSTLTLLGDNIGATPFVSGILLDNPTIASLNELKPVGSTIGNHELDLGQDAFRARLNGTSAEVNGKTVQFVKIGFPYTGANVEGLGHFADGTPYLRDYVEFTTPQGTKIAFIGAIAEDVPAKLAPNTTVGMKFNDPIKRINTLAKELKEQKGFNVVVAMLDDDVQKNLGLMDAKYVDALMGGDTHVNYNFTQGEGGHKISGTASGSYTDNLSLIRVSYDKKTKKVVKTQAIRIPAAEVAKCDNKTSVAAQNIEKIVEEAKKQSESAGTKVVAEGFTPGQHWDRAVVYGQDGKSKGPGSNRGHESTLGSLVANAMKAEILDEQHHPVDIGIINAGGIRDDLAANDQGQLTAKNIFDIAPFSNEVGYVTLTGAQFKQVLEEQWKTGLTTQNSRPMLKLGLSDNVKYTFDTFKKFGERITSLTIDGKPYDPNKKYTIGSVTFLLAGGDSFDTLKAGGKYKTSGNLDRDQIAKFLREAPKDKLQPRVAKSGVGITFGNVPATANTEVKLRGLSFTEGPGMLDMKEHAAEAVTVNIGGASFSAQIDPSLAESDLTEADYNDPHAVANKAPITTDGAGRATVKVEFAKVCKTLGGGKHAAPVQVNTSRAGELVAKSAGLTWEFACPTSSTPDKGGNVGSHGGNGGKGGHHSNNTGHVGHGKTSAHNLARTGVATGAIALIAMTCVAAGVAARRFQTK
ncbi:MAG: 5'-nucleotidase C-terminal domain-containing protein [Actinomycetaceae bacterium]|nr:5'-nucleotidase C-terminal domain-containing protein [Actinomycetaceae bacterium]